MKHAVTPCAECPWRKDVAPGKFPPDRYIELARTAYDMARSVFACHMGKEDGLFACAGFVLQSSAHNLSCRQAGMPFQDVRSPYPLFRTYREVAIANGVRPGHPALTHCRDDGQLHPDAD